LCDFATTGSVHTANVGGVGATIASENHTEAANREP
jgi:hypothetical protein